MTDEVKSVAEIIDALMAERASCNAAIDGAKYEFERASADFQATIAEAKAGIELLREDYARTVEDASKRKQEIELELAPIYEKLGVNNPLNKPRRGPVPGTVYTGKPRGRPRKVYDSGNGPDVGEFPAPQSGGDDFDQRQPYDAAE